MKITENMVLFWGSVFSQWSKETDNGNYQFKAGDICFVTAEQYMMWRKALLFDDFEIAEKILNTRDPKEQKSLGRKVKNFSEETWKLSCEDIVFEGNLLKFSQNPSLKKELLSYEGKQFVEASPHDKIWGIGLHFDDVLALNQATWKGTNLLGQALDKVRETIR